MKVLLFFSHKFGKISLFELLSKYPLKSKIVENE